jgi:hypothetical protein
MNGPRLPPSGEGETAQGTYSPRVSLVTPHEGARTNTDKKGEDTDIRNSLREALTFIPVIRGFLAIIRVPLAMSMSSVGGEVWRNGL